MLDQIEGFSGSLPFFFHYDSHDGMIGLMRIGDRPQALIGSEYEFFEKKHIKAAKAFVSGRSCIRALQKRLSLPEFELLPGEYGPVWPNGLVGSISHSKELVTATIIRDAVTVGIDIEERSRLKPEAIDRVVTSQERQKYSNVPGFDWTLLFSAKESVFKAISPLVRCHIGFREVELTADLTGRSFSVNYLGNKIDPKLFENSKVHWSIFADHLITLVTVK